MRKLSFNPLTGLMVSTAHEDGRDIVKYEQDCEPFWDINAEYRANTERTRKGIKDGFMHAAFVPDLVIMDMLTKHGVNFYDKAQGKQVLKLLETEYTKCKTADKKLA
jgi:uncharacterized protein (DUF885 family)